MNHDPRTQTELLLRRAQTGDQQAMSDLLARIYKDLRKLAGARFRGEAPGHTLQPTALVHEAYLRMVDSSQVQYEDRTHFLAFAGRVMRQILIDHARRRRAEKRGGSRVRVSLEEDGVVTDDCFEKQIDLMTLSDLLEDLARRAPRRARVVELRFFSGLTLEETAAVLGLNPKTVEADWYGARAWLRRELRRRGAS